MRPARRLPVRLAAAMCPAAALAAAGCGGSAHDPQTASVLYAGSLTSMMERDLGPAFARHSGDGYEGYGAGSTEVAQQVRSGVRPGDVFISASARADALLEGAAGGRRVRWYATFAQAPLLLAYDPHGALAGPLRHEPWYRAISAPGVRVGRTDPRLDPKGVLTVAAVDDAARRLGRPQLRRTLAGLPVFPEETLVARLESGQLDAAFLYANEATEQHLPAVSLRPATERATYTVSVLSDAPHRAGGIAFVRYLLGPQGQATLRRHGLTVLGPRLHGPASAVPAALRPLVGAR